MKRNYHWLNHLLNFLAVILGVYLAFYINDAAQAREESKERTILMTSMINDLASDIKTYEAYQIPVNEKYQVAIDSLLEFLIEGNLPEVQNHIPALLQLENYAPTNSTYVSMKSAGKLKLLDDLALQKELSDFYDGLVLECNKKNEIQADYFMQEIVQWLTVHVDLEKMTILRPQELMVLKNRLLIFGSLVEQKIENYKMVVEESKALQEQLQSVLDR